MTIKTPRAICTAVLASALFAGLAGAAQARNASDETPVGNIATPDDRNRIAAYWTPERMEGASVVHPVRLDPISLTPVAGKA